MDDEALGGELDPPVPVTVVIPARNEAASIARCLESVLEQEYRDIEVLVVDGMSDDGTDEIVQDVSRHDPRVRLVRNPEQSIAPALNLGLRQARGEVLVRVDAHSVIEPGYIARSVELLLADPALGGVGGVKLAEGEGRVGKSIAAAYGSRFSVGNSTYHFAEEPHLTDHVPFGVYWTHVARDLGGWDPGFPVNQDFEFDHRLQLAGWHLLLDPGIRVRWRCRSTFRGLFLQYRRYGRGKAAVMWAHPRSTRARHLVPTGFLATLLCLSAGGSRARRGAVVAVVIYAMVDLVNGKIVSRRHNDRPAPHLVATASATMHAGYAVGVAEGLMTGGLLRSTDRREMGEL